MDGILNINKPTGMTSHDVVAKIRKLLKQKRVGHAGTLDPAASGVLPICLGQATRVAEYLSESGKAYQADIILGIVTDTYDSEGTAIRTSIVIDDHAAVGADLWCPSPINRPETADGDIPPPIYRLDLTHIEHALQHFLGPQMQTPPPYSAIKIHGQPAYKRARAGEAIFLQPRAVTIYELNILQWHPPRLTLSIECSKGTYIRSLAHDLGEQLGCGAHLGALQRTRSGPFSLSESIILAQLEQSIEAGTIEHYLHPADKALQDYPVLVLDKTSTQHVLHGNPFTLDHRPGHSPNDLARVYDAAGHFLAIATWDPDRRMWQPKKVLLPYC
jgi:tRNA pseudouridine55 synthase